MRSSKGTLTGGRSRLSHAGFTLTLFASLAVSCVIARRIWQPDLPRPFSVWLYPMTPMLFLGVSAWMMFWALQGRPVESLLGLATVAFGGLLFAFFGRESGAEADPE